MCAKLSRSIDFSKMTIISRVCVCFPSTEFNIIFLTASFIFFVVFCYLFRLWPTTELFGFVAIIENSCRFSHINNRVLCIRLFLLLLLLSVNLLHVFQFFVYCSKNHFFVMNETRIFFSYIHSCLREHS